MTAHSCIHVFPFVILFNICVFLFIFVPSVSGRYQPMSLFEQLIHRIDILASNVSSSLVIIKSALQERSVHSLDF
jgi:hypothetical protein